MKDKIYEEFVASLPSLEGKVVAISGTTSGTGYWAAHATIEKNAAAVLMLNRPSKRSESAVKILHAVKEKLKSSTEIVHVDCDLMNFETVSKAATKVMEFCEGKGGLDVLCNNAGIMGFPDRRTSDGYDLQIQTNHLSSFLLCRELLPVLKQASETRGEARIVNHSSTARNIKLGMKKSLKGHLDGTYFEKHPEGALGGSDLPGNFGRYHHSKLANTVFTMELKKRLGGAGLNIKALAADPGVATTDLGSSLASAQTKRGLNALQSALILALQLAFSAADGSCPLLACCFAEDAESGDLYIPKERTKGIPVKAITAGVENTNEVDKDSEEFTLNPESAKILWERSEAAVGTLSFT